MSTRRELNLTTLALEFRPFFEGGMHERGFHGVCRQYGVTDDTFQIMRAFALAPLAVNIRRDRHERAVYDGLVNMFTDRDGGRFFNDIAVSNVLGRPYLIDRYNHYRIRLYLQLFGFNCHQIATSVAVRRGLMQAGMTPRLIMSMRAIAGNLYAIQHDAGLKYIDDLIREAIVT